MVCQLMDFFVKAHVDGACCMYWRLWLALSSTSVGCVFNGLVDVSIKNAAIHFPHDEKRALH